jgi:putative PIN family toxin of toxin-antitoxin system
LEGRCLQRPSIKSDIVVAISPAISYLELVRLVLDTAVIVAAMRSDSGASRWLLRAALEQRTGLALVVSVPLLVEYEAVMTRADHLRAAGVSTRDVNVLLDAITAVAEPVHLDFLWRPTLNDPDDDMVLETAINGMADAIVTFNLRDFTPAASRFEVSVLLPRDAIRRLEM